MLTTAEAAATSEASGVPDDPAVTQPVRLLVPTRRRSTLFLSERDTLMASDLGITRFSTDEDLERIAQKHSRDYPHGDLAQHVRQLRDGLAQPRDIEEARDWGLKIEVTDVENAEEVKDDPNLHLGWWWVYDLNRVETRAQRRARYQLDGRLVDTKGLGRLWCRAYLTVKGRKNKSDRARDILSNTDGVLDQIVEAYLAADPSLKSADVRQAQITKAEKFLLKGTPAPVDRAGQSDLFSVWQGLDSGRDVGALNEWYEYEKIRQSGRPIGSRTRNRRTSTGS